MPRNNYGDLSKTKLTNKEKKLIILWSIGLIVIKSKETRVITYTCRYSSGLIHPDMTEL